MFMPSADYRKQVFPLAVMSYEEEDTEIAKYHNPETCQEPECVNYRKEEQEYKRRMEELRHSRNTKNNNSSKKSKHHIFLL